LWVAEVLHNSFITSETDTSVCIENEEGWALGPVLTLGKERKFFFLPRIETKFN